MPCEDCATRLSFQHCPIPMTLGHLPHQHPLSIADTHLRFRTLEDATRTLARLLFTPPTLPEAVRRIDTIEAAKAFQISICAVMHHFPESASTPSCDMYRFWMDGGWQNGDWEDDENDSLCPVAFLVGILFDREWIRINFECDSGDAGVAIDMPWVPTPSQSLALENPWAMIESILKSTDKMQCNVACQGLTFVYIWWHEHGGGEAKKNRAGIPKSAWCPVFWNMLGTS
jgi:hypothetical protein